ncbi:MAG: hypothetical protein HQM07_09670, partial [Zetaproteobacteria bacterium]|nr:hypothetical protein [Zetaproteobacteria bacterium]
MNNLTLRIVLENKDVVNIPVDGYMQFVVDPGAVYQMVESESGEVISNLTLKKHGEDLIIEVDQEDVVSIQDFYNDEYAEAFVDVGQSDTLSGANLISRYSPIIDGENIVWEAASHEAEAVVGSAELDAAMVDGGFPWLTAAGVAAGIGGAAAGIAALNGNAANPAPVVNTINGNIVGGIVIAGNDLVVNIFAADGATLLATAVVNPDGSFTAQIGSYSGPVIAKVVNNGAAADYVDEATGLAKNLNAELSSVGVVLIPNSTITLNINAATTIAATKAIQSVPVGTPLDTATVTNTNTAIAQALGIADLQNTVVAATNSTTYATATAASQTYGAVLAALSGADTNNGGNTQTTITTLVNAITVTGNQGTLTTTATTIINAGASTVDSLAAQAKIDAANALTAAQAAAAQAPNDPALAAAAAQAQAAADATGAAAATTVASTLSTVTTAAPTAPTNAPTVAAGPDINAAEDAAGIVLAGSLSGAGAGVGDTVEVLLGGVAIVPAQTHVLTLAEVQSGIFSMTLAPGSLGADGAKSLSIIITDINNNVGLESPALSLMLDTLAPAVAISSGVLTNALSPIVSGTAEAGSTVTVVIAGATYSTIATGGVWSIDTATATPVSGTLALNANGTNSVSATSTDAAGNVSTPATQTLTLDTLAPAVAITSGVLTNIAAPVVSGTAEAGSTVTVVIAGATYSTIATGGVWSIDTATATPVSGTLALNANGTNSVSATSTDAAGNASTPATQTLAIDTLAANAPTFN